MSEDLKTAIVKFLNVAPMEGDYALLILSLCGTVKPEQEQMIEEYSSARKGLLKAYTQEIANATL